MLVRIFMVLQVLFEENFVFEPLIDEAALPYIAVEYFFGVEADQSIEESVEFIVGIVLGSHYSAHPLYLLPPRLEMHSQLDGDIRTWKIDGSVAHSAEENHIDLVATFEQFVYLQPLVAADLAMDERILEFLRIVFQYMRAIAKHKDFVSSGFVSTDQILQHFEFGGIASME